MFETVSVNSPTTWAPIRHVVVVIPAHNEALRIVPTIAAVRASAIEVAHRVSVSIVVVADACTDNTEVLATQSLAKPSGGVSSGVVIVTHRRQAGAARLAGAATGLAIASVPTSHVWIANTDADSVVSKTWIQRQLDASAEGYAAIAGVVELVDDADYDEELGRRFSTYYQSNIDGTHDHVHGANLGLRADAYESVGRWRALPTGEDHDLWRRLGAAGFPRLSDSSFVVATSARRVGRAPDGFARDLVALGPSPRVA